MSQELARREVARAIETLDRSKQFQHEVKSACAALLEDGVDFGRVEGIPQAFLWVGGADKLLRHFKLAAYPRIAHEEYETDTGHYSVTIETHVVHLPALFDLIRQGIPQEEALVGATVAIAHGYCSTKESKYGYVWVNWDSDESPPPDLETRRAHNGRLQVRRSRTRSELESMRHTIIAMAQKRARVMGCRQALGLTSAFSQDEDLVAEIAAAGRPIQPRAMIWIARLADELGLDAMPDVNVGNLSQVTMDLVTRVIDKRCADDVPEAMREKLLRAVVETRRLPDEIKITAENVEAVVERLHVAAKSKARKRR